MLSRIALRKPTVQQTWQRVRRDRETGIPGRLMTLTKHPTREELESWAIQIGHNPICYLTAWVCLTEEAHGQTLPHSTNEASPVRAGGWSRFRWRNLPARVGRWLC